jgi:hypothetical protein
MEAAMRQPVGCTAGAMLVHALGEDTLGEVSVPQLCSHVSRILRSRLQQRRVFLRQQNVCMTMAGRWTHLSTCSTSHGAIDVALALSLSEPRFAMAVAALGDHAADEP